MPSAQAASSMGILSTALTIYFFLGSSERLFILPRMFGQTIILAS